MKSIIFLLLVLGSFSCFKPGKTLSDLTEESFAKRHKQNLESLSIICPTIDGSNECLQKYSLEYRIWKNKKYLYEIKYK
jgi:hypothetical protein